MNLDLQGGSLPSHCSFTIEHNLLHAATNLKLDRLPLSVGIFDDDWSTEYVGHGYCTRLKEDPHLLLGVGIDNVFLPWLERIILRIFQSYRFIVAI